MIKLLIIIIFAILISLYTIFDAIFFSIVIFFNKNLVLRHSIRVIKFIFNFLIAIAGVKVNVTGTENLHSLDNEKSYMVISNHRGFFDVISGYLLFDKNIGIVAKKSIGTYIVVRYWMKRINCLFLDRNNLRDGVKVVIDSINNINNGISMWIFPEGTRCKSDNPLDLLEFKKGAFKIPEKTNCYILPISFKNTDDVFEKQKPFLKPSNIYINIGKPYRISDLNDEDKLYISEYSQNVIRKLLMEDN